MPNTLAHAGVQGLLSRTALPDIDLRWAYLGVVIPDIPWILQRAALFAVPGIDPYLLRSYVVIQASLLGSLILCAAIAFIARRFWLTFAILGGNAVLHLVLDAMQTKWANGVHFLAPFSWELTNWGLFWPESPVTYVLTALGLIVILWYWRPAWQDKLDLVRPGMWRLGGMTFLSAAYFTLPFLLLQAPIDADTHYLETLSTDQDRAGRHVEIDRGRYVNTEDGALLTYYAGADQVPVEPMEIESRTVISVRGVFIEDNEVRVTEHRVHAGALRDYASYLGLAMVFILLIHSLVRSTSAYRVVARKDYVQ